jgi:NADH:ubiquinone oxidoreductase subunit 5 (subunit L)/multisubunit Na+/H+ antiporter MnhA subunit
MNNSVYVVSGIIALVFLVAKFLEMRFSNKPDEENEAAVKPLKVLLRDALLVYVSSLLGFFLVTQFEEHAAVGSSAAKEVAAFTGGPDF